MLKVFEGLTKNNVDLMLYKKWLSKSILESTEKEIVTFFSGEFLQTPDGQK
jgi:hypothetical protein